ncbi:MAG: hypothetical protein IJX39_08440 [Clostridia bacterium]|nr:hypothetical protein [Clostridia bacterium]
MGGEILALFGVAFAAALADLLVPGEEKGGTRQFLHFLTALVVLLLLLRPFLSLLGGADGFLQGNLEWEQDETVKADYEQVFADAVASRSAVELKEGLSDLLQEEFGIAQGDCEITVALSDSGELERVAVFLSGAALLRDPEQIENRLSELFDCTVEVR